MGFVGLRVANGEKKRKKGVNRIKIIITATTS